MRYYNTVIAISLRKLPVKLYSTIRDMVVLLLCSSYLPVEFESLCQHSPVSPVRAGGVQAAADLLSDEVWDLEGAGPRQS